MNHLASLNRPVSPPLPTSARSKNENSSNLQAHYRAPNRDEGRTSDHEPELAAVEAGKVNICDHLSYFSSHLSRASRPAIASIPRIPIDEFIRLYKRSRSSAGHHFVIHQHDHPVSGVHYDLRLQFSESSSVSFAVPYGMPGDPNSRRQLRMAIETRVHNLWNHLVESASHATGSLLIWDIGEYEILPKPRHADRETDDELPKSEDAPDLDSNLRVEPAKLREAFKTRRVRLRLHGTKLPKNYTINLRLSSANNHSTKTARNPRKRRRKAPPSVQRATDYSTDDEEATQNDDRTTSSTTATSSRATSIATNTEHDEAAAGLASDISGDEDDRIRTNNAYPGATNSIGSVHQRRWVLTLDRPGSGFVQVRKGPDRGRWIRNPQPREGRVGTATVDGGGERGGWEPFYVRGRDGERSVVTGRLAMEVMEDEGVKGYAGRKMWMPILE